MSFIKVILIAALIGTIYSTTIPKSFLNSNSSLQNEVQVEPGKELNNPSSGKIIISTAQTLLEKKK